MKVHHYSPTKNLAWKKSLKKDATFFYVLCETWGLSVKCDPNWTKFSHGTFETWLRGYYFCMTSQPMTSQHHNTIFEQVDKKIPTRWDLKHLKLSVLFLRQNNGC